MNKRLNSPVLVATLLLCGAVALNAAIEPKAPVFTGTGTAGGTTNSYYVAPIGPGTPIIYSLHFQPELAAATATFSVPTNQLLVTGYTNASGTPYLTFNTTAGGLLSAGQKCIHYRRAIGVYTYAWVSATNAPGSGANVFATMGATTAGAANGDVLYMLSPVSTLWVSNAAPVTIQTPGGFIAGKPGLPLGVECTAASATGIRHVFGRYE